VPITRIYRNEGDGNFAAIEAPLVGLENSRLAWGDYDNDADLDLLCTGQTTEGNQTTDHTILYRNDNGTFVDSNVTLPGSVGPSGWVDYDNDGKLDMFLASPNDRIYRNQGNGTFVDSGKYFLQNGPVVWADFDRDGDL